MTEKLEVVFQGSGRHRKLRVDASMRSHVAEQRFHVRHAIEIVMRQHDAVAKLPDPPGDNRRSDSARERMEILRG